MRPPRSALEVEDWSRKFAQFAHPPRNCLINLILSGDKLKASAQQARAEKVQSVELVLDMAELKRMPVAELRQQLTKWKASIPPQAKKRKAVANNYASLLAGRGRSSLLTALIGVAAVGPGARPDGGCLLQRRAPRPAKTWRASLHHDGWWVRSPNATCRTCKL